MQKWFELQIVQIMHDRNKKGEIFSFGYNKNCQCGIPNMNGEKDIINNPTNISLINQNIN